MSTDSIFSSENVIDEQTWQEHISDLFCVIYFVAIWLNLTLALILQLTEPDDRPESCTRFQRDT